MSILDDQELFSKGLQLFKDNNLDNSLNYINKIKNKNLNTLKLLSQIYKKKNDVKNTKIILNKIMNLDKKNLYALYNLGVMYYNKGGDMLNEANNIKDFKKYDHAKKKAENLMLKGLPYIEKCHELDNLDRNILLVLKELYYRNGNNSKYKEISEKLK